MSTKDTSAPSPRGLNLREACRYSGLALWTIRQLIKDGKLPVVRLGRGFVVLRDDLDTLLSQARGVQPARAGINSESKRKIVKSGAAVRP